MNIEIYSVDIDNVIASTVATGRLTYESALNHLFPLINRFSHQRKIQTPDFYKRLSKDILDGCIMPPLTIAFVASDFENTGDFKKSDVENYVKNNINNGYILDGIQRLNTLYNISEEEGFDKNRNLYVNIILSKNKDMLLYRMITLNNGQKPMSPRHQIEVLTKELFDFKELEIEVQSEKDRSENIIRGSFNLADISKGYMAYITGNINNENNKIISEKMDEIIVKNIFENAKANKHDFSSVLSLIDKLSEDAPSKKWLKTQNNLIGFCVGIRNSLEDFSSITPGDFSNFTNNFETAFKSINPSKVNLGRYRRELASKVVSKISEFISKSSSEMTDFFIDETSI